MDKRFQLSALRWFSPLLTLLLAGCVTHYYPAPQPVVMQSAPGGENPVAGAGSPDPGVTDEAYTDESLNPYGDFDGSAGEGAGEAIAPAIDGVMAPSVTYVVGANYYPWWSLDHFYLGFGYGYGWGGGFSVGYRFGSGCGWGWGWYCPWYPGWAWRPWYRPPFYYAYWPPYHFLPHYHRHYPVHRPHPAPLPGGGVAVAGGNRGSSNPNRPSRPTQGDGAPDPVAIPNRPYLSVPPTQGPVGRNGEGPVATRRLGGVSGGGNLARSVRSPSAGKAPDFLKPQPVKSRPDGPVGAHSPAPGGVALTPPSGRSVRVISSSPGYAPSRPVAPVASGAVVQRPGDGKSRAGGSGLKPQPVAPVRATGSVRSISLPRATVTVTNPRPPTSRNVSAPRPAFGAPSSPARSTSRPPSSPSRQGGYRMATPRAPVQATPPRISTPSPRAPKVRGYKGRAD